jgi:Pectate lyase superfamily protein
VNGDPATAYRVESSSDLKRWDRMAITSPSTGLFPPSSQFEVADREFMFGGQKFYRAVPADAPQGSATNAAPDIIVSEPLLTFYEGGSGTFAVQLAKAPASTVVIQVSRTDGSTNILVSGGQSLTFGASNWNSPQTVTVSAGKDSDFEDSLATLTVSSSQLAPRTVRVRAVDSDVDDEFVGPFASWKDVKRDFGAKGDGTTDDTAALQSALDTLRAYANNIGVLYIPAGTYRITQTLSFIRSADSEPEDVIIVGEDPSSTTIRWDGATNGVMIAYGAWYSKMARLTFDGAGKAKTAIAHGAAFSTHNEFSDMVFTDLSFGIEAGTPDGQGNAETAVERCLFVVLC